MSQSQGVVEVQNKHNGDKYVGSAPSPLHPGDVVYLHLADRPEYDGDGYTEAVLNEDNSLDYLYDPNPDVSGATISFSYDLHEEDPEPYRELTGVFIGPSGSRQQVLQLGYTRTGLLTLLSGACGTCGLGYAEYSYDDYGAVTVAKDANGTVVQHKEYDYAIPNRPMTKVTTGGLARWRTQYDYDYTGASFNSYNVTKYQHVTNTTARVRIEQFTGPGFTSPTRVYVYNDLTPVDLSTGQRYTTQYVDGFDDNAPLKLTKHSTISDCGRIEAAHYDASDTGNSSGQVTKRTIGVSEKVQAEYVYSAADGMGLVRVSEDCDARGGCREYEYESRSISDPYSMTLFGLLTKQIEPETDAGRATRGYEYDNRRRATKQWYGPGNSSDITTVYQYDDRDNLTSHIAAWGTALASTTDYAYDLGNYQTKITGPYHTSITDPGSSVATKQYSLTGQLQWEAVREEVSNPGDVLSETMYEYDENGRLTKKLVANEPGAFTLGDSGTHWITTRYAYDSAGRKTAVTEDEGTGGLNLVTRYEYNNQDEVVRTTTPGGVWTYTMRDGRGLVVKEIVGYQGSTPATELTTQYQYDGDGNVTQQTPSSGETTTYQYDGYGRRTKAIRG